MAPTTCPREAVAMHTGSASRRLSFLSLAPVTALLLASCSADADPDWSLDNIDVGERDLNEFEQSFRSGSVSPDGTLVAIGGSGEICIQAIDERRAECAELDTSADPRSITWSDDGSTVYFSGDLLIFADEPDVMALDTSSLELEVLTDDGIDGRPFRADGDALLDLTPFVGPGGDVYFFRAQIEPGGDSEFELFRLDDDASDALDAEQVGSLDLPRNSFPLGPIRKIDDDRWIVAVSSPDAGGQAVYLIDFANEELSEIETGFNLPTVVDVASGLALVADQQDRRPDTPRYELIDLETGQHRGIDVDLAPTEAIFAAGFSPNGTSIAFLVSDRGASNEVIALPIEGGRADEDQVQTLIDGRELEDLGVILGFGETGEIGWTSEHLLLHAPASNQFVTFEITPNS